MPAAPIDANGGTYETVLDAAKNQRVARRLTKRGLNPAFDSRMGYSGHIGAPTSKGFIEVDTSGPLASLSTTSGNFTPPAGRINFLFNPSELNVSHNVNADSISGTANNPKYEQSEGDILGYFGTASFSLLFDRTYELWYKTVPNGVYADVLAFYYMLGIAQTHDKVVPNGVSKNNNGNFSQIYTLVGENQPTAPMQFVNVWVILGAITLYGYLTEFDVDYTHWSQDMIPQRCAINVSMQLMTPNGKIATNDLYNFKKYFTSKSTTKDPTQKGKSKNSPGAGSWGSVPSSGNGPVPGL